MPLTPSERENFRALYNVVAVAVIQGELMEITYVKHRKEFRFPGKRGSIKGFTPSARLRMLRTIAIVDWPRVPPSLFITLTYPDSRSGRDARTRNRDRYLFVRNMENYLNKKVGVLWRIEWKPRQSGANQGTMVPHVHLIVFDCKFIPWQRIRKWWRDVLRVDGPLCTDVQRIEGGKKVAGYVAKYCSKPMAKNPSLDIASYLNTGRHWGICRRELIPFCQRRIHRLTDPRHIQLAENAACMTFPYFTRDVQQGFSLFGPKAEKVIAEIYRTDIDDWLATR